MTHKEDDNLKISGFTLTTNATKFGYPFIESIKSFLPVVDELIVVDGGSTDDTIKMIEAIGDKKIRIINDEFTKWEDDWTYSRMGKNKQRGYSECKGDVVIKFDADWILHEHSIQYNTLLDDIEYMILRGKLSMVMCRKCINLQGESFLKKQKTIAVNKSLCEALNISVDYRLNKEVNNWAFEPVGTFDSKRKMLLDSKKDMCGSDVIIYNYGFFFSTIKQIGWARKRHIDAENREKGKDFVITEQKAFDAYLKSLIGYRDKMKESGGLFDMELTKHPAVIQKMIENVKINQQGYSFFEELI